MRRPDDVPPLHPTARQPPLHFAGRERELADFAGMFEDVRRLGRPPGGLVLVDGVQGVGKTQLIKHFASTVVGDDGAGVLAMTTNDLDAEPEQLLARILEAAGATSAQARGSADLLGRITDAKASGFAVKVDRPRTRQPLNAMLDRSRRLDAWHGRELLVLIDEIQGLTPSQRSTLRDLHEGAHGCPIMVMCAGLQHSVDVLSGTLADASGNTDDRGISRFAGRYTLGPLARGETKEAIVHGAERYGIAIGDELADELAACAMDFPQHIHGYLQGVIRAMAGRQGEPGLEEIAAAVTHGNGVRMAYYEERCRGMSYPNLMPALASAMQAADVKKLSWNFALQVLETQGAEAPADVLVSAMKHGVLTRSADHDVSFGIPSFHDFMCAKAKAIEEQRAREARCGLRPRRSLRLPKETRPRPATLVRGTETRRGRRRTSAALVYRP